MKISPINNVSFRNNNMKSNINNNHFHSNNLKNNNTQSDMIQISFKSYHEKKWRMPTPEWTVRNKPLENLKWFANNPIPRGNDDAYYNIVLVDDVPYYVASLEKAQEIFDTREIGDWENKTRLKERPESLKEYQKALVEACRAAYPPPEEPFWGKLSQHWNIFAERLSEYYNERIRADQVKELYKFIDEGRIKYDPDKVEYKLNPKSNT